jgi:ELWxxDGT repeat protein
MRYLNILFVFLLSTTYCQAQYSFSMYNLNPFDNSDPQELTSVGGKVYFSAFFDTTGREPYISDGTQAGTHILKDIATGYDGSAPQYFTEYNGKVYFSAYSYGYGNEMWVTDGTAAGTTQLADIYPTGSSGNPKYLTVYNGKLYFQATNYNEGNELWVTDGTSAGTQILKDINPGTANSQPSGITIFNGKLYFAASDAANGHELWTSDGTAAGTYMVKDLLPGSQGSGPSAFIEMNGKLYFSATTYSGKELWVTDGTATGTYMVKDIAPNNSSGIMTLNAIVLNNALLFYADNNSGQYGSELWYSDGTGAGTYLLADIFPGSTGSNASAFLMKYNNKAYFTANNGFGSNGFELWETDGTTGGTKMACDILPGAGASFPLLLAVYNGNMFMTANRATGDKQLYVSNGIPPGTALIAPPAGTKNNALGSNSSNKMVESNGSLFFAAAFDTAGVELWSLKSTTKVATQTEEIPSCKIYPNPNNGTFTLQLDNTNFSNGSIKVHDMMGREIFKSQITNPKSQITLQQPKGIYLVKLQLDDVVLTKQIMME